MDTPLSENRSNLLVYVAAIAAVVALVLGMVSLVQLSKIKKRIGDVDLAKLSSDVLDASQKAANAVTTANTANSANNPAIRSLSTTISRDVGNELADIRGNIQRVEDLAKQAAERPASVASSGGGGGGGSGVVTAPPGSLDADGAYVIKSGDNYGKIAPQFGVTVAEIISANPGVDPRKLKVGQKIIIPKR